MSAIPFLHCVSVPSRDEPALSALDPADPLIWHCAERTLLGAGVAASIELGEDRFDEAQAWFDAVVDRARISDEVGRPGSGPVAFGSFSFFVDSPSGSRLVIPRTIWGRDNEGYWRTDIRLVDPGADPADPASATELAGNDRAHARHAGDEQMALPDSFGPVTEVPGLAGRDYLAAVERMRGRLRAGDAHKAVLARELAFVTERPIDQRLLARKLATAFPDCWTFAVDGLVGSTPEMLASVRGGTLSSRVLAGSWPVSGDRQGATRALLSSVKDRHEHDYALASVHDAIAPRTRKLWVSERFALQLPHVIHLATDMTAELAEPHTGLTCCGAMHPTAAVGGSPTQAALGIIRDIEEADRGRYAAPVGWMDGAGNADWALALRCAEVDGTTARAFAGGGIMSDSDPVRELNETEAKFSAIRDALS
ncbi:MAG: isochorismate synthase [Flaviflexus sp.]|nr:isochorismate synthase [Flaviflexus sp.]